MRRTHPTLNGGAFNVLSVLSLPNANPWQATRFPRLGNLSHPELSPGRETKSGLLWTPSVP